MFKDFFRYGVTEVVNSIRAAAYVRNGLTPVGAIIRDCTDCGDLPEVLGDGEEYRTPALDDAPWFTPEDPDSADFAGVQVVEVTGLSGSTMTTEVEERVGNGGIVGARRATSKTIQVTADLIGRTPEATQVGMEWLSGVLHPPCAESADCKGDSLHLFSTCPQACEGVTDQTRPVETVRYDDPAAFTGNNRHYAPPLTNHVLNGSFELGSASTLDNWTSTADWIFNAGTLSRVAYADNPSLPNLGIGTHVGRLTVGATTASPSTVRQVITGLTVGKTYTLSGWVYVSPSAGGRWALAFIGATFGQSNTVTRAGEWVYVQWSMAATATSHTVGIVSVDNGTNPATAGGNVYFDGLMVTEGSSAGGTGFSGSSTELWSTSDAFGLYTAPASQVLTPNGKESVPGGVTGAALTLTWAAALSGSSTRHASYGLVAFTQPGEVYTIAFDVYVPSGSPDVQPNILFEDEAHGPWITVKDGWVHVEMTVVATGSFIRFGLQHFVASPGAGKTVRVDNVRAWQMIGGLDVNRGYFDGATPDAPLDNIAGGVALVGTGSAVLDTPYPRDGVVWTKVVTTSASAVRAEVPAGLLANNQTYVASYLVTNPGTTDVDVTVEWARGGPSYYTLLPGETRRLYGRGKAASYANVIDRRADLGLPDSGGSTILFREFRLTALNPREHDWQGAANASKSTLTPLGSDFVFDSPDGDSVLRGPLLGPVCDHVRVEWTVTSAFGNVVQVIPAFVGPGGRRTQYGQPVSVGSVPVVVTMDADASPEFPEGWTPTLETLPEGWLPPARVIPNDSIPSGSLRNPEALIPFWNAVAHRDEQRVNVLTIGDSITEGVGVGAGGWDQRRPRAVQTALRSIFPAAHAQSAQADTPVTNYSGLTTPGLGGPALTAAVQTHDYGLGGKAFALLNGHGNLTFSFTGRHLRMWYAWRSGFQTSTILEVTIDGGAMFEFEIPFGTPEESGQFWDVPIPAYGAHTISVRAKSAGLPFILERFEVFESDADRDTGIHVYDGAHGGWASHNFVPTMGFPSTYATWHGAKPLKPVLTTIQLGTNDWAFGRTPAQIVASIEQMIGQIDTIMGSDPYSVLVLIPMGSTRTDPDYPEEWAAIRQALWTLAGGNVAVADVDSVWPDPGTAEFNALMYETFVPQLHPNLAGHGLTTQFYSNVLAKGWDLRGTPEGQAAVEPGQSVVVHGLEVSHRPVLSIEECVEPYRRTFHNVVTVAGPTVVEERTLGDTTEGSSVTRVEWTWVATNPFAWHEPTFIAQYEEEAFTGAPGVQNWFGSVTAASTNCPRPAPSVATCADDPGLSPYVLPPQAPAIPDPAAPNLTGVTFFRERFKIPSDLMPQGVGAFSWEFRNDGTAKKGVRVRIYEDDDPGFTMPDECSFVEEFWIYYLGPNQTLTIDGPSGDVTVYCGDDVLGQPIYADGLRNLRGSYGGPFVNSPVGCGRAYTITVDFILAQGDINWTLDLTRRS